MQADGNLVVYDYTGVAADAAGAATWASDTCGRGEAPYELEVQSDGNLVLYDATRAATWASRTNEAKEE